MAIISLSADHSCSWPDEYSAELDRMNAAVMAENYNLQHDNKQLSALTKEYEQTLESIMS